ncbi:MAG: hypothetical protein WCH07_06375 [Deltaproteobacteria bacterium]
MKKEQLLRHCQEAIKTEETANTVYLKHLSAIVLRSGLPESDIAKIKDTIEFLIAINTTHKELLQLLVNRILEEDIDVY